MIKSLNKDNYTFKEVADEIGCTPSQLQKVALEIGLIDKYGFPTKFALEEGLLCPNFEMGNEDCTCTMSVGLSPDDGMIYIEHIPSNEHEVVQSMSMRKEYAKALGEFLIRISEL